MILTSLQRWYALLAIYVSIIAMTVTSIVYANHVSSSASRQFCDIVTTLDDAYKSQPPITPTGRKLAADMHTLRLRLHCTE